MRRFLLILLVCLQTTFLFAQEDVIPGNCPYTYGVYYQESHFPRYEAHNQRLVLADWISGNDIVVLATEVTSAQVEIEGWSPECQYLSVSYGSPDEQNVMIWDTVIYDVSAGIPITTFEDARHIPFPLTWDTNSTQVLVETRLGAYLWKISGEQVWLTSNGDYNAQSFVRGTLVWNYGEDTLTGRITLGVTFSVDQAIATYNMSTGELLSLTSQDGQPITLSANSAYRDAEANPDNPYPCRATDSSYYPDQFGGYATIDNVRVLYEPQNQRIVMRDAGTRDVLQVIAENIEITRYERETWLAGCQTLVYEADDQLVFYNMEAAREIFRVTGRLYLSRLRVDPTGQYIIITTQVGAELYHLQTGAHFTLIPYVYFSMLGSGSRWSYNRVEWDLPNGQVRLILNSTYTAAYPSASPLETRVFDLNSGILLNVLDWQGQTVASDELVNAQTQQAAPYGCYFTVNYQVYNQRVILETFRNGDFIDVLEDELVTDGFRYLGKSPDCRYIAASVGTADDSDTVIWDLATKSRVGVFENAVDIPHGLNWSPFGGYVVVSTRNGGYLWHLPTDTRVQLTAQAGSSESEIDSFYSYYYSSQTGYRSFYYLEWDMAQGQLLAVPLDRLDTVIAYDLASGAAVAEYGVAGRSEPVQFLQLPDNRLLVYTTRSGQQSDDATNGLALWNRSTGSGIQLSMPFYVVPYYGANQRSENPELDANYRLLNYGNPVFSSDGRYMLMTSRNYGYVWDLSALAGSEPYAPNVYPLEGTLGAHFLDNATFTTFREVTTVDQYRRGEYEIASYIYNADDGSLVSASSQVYR
jgi:hypothetical protein